MENNGMITEKFMPKVGEVYRYSYDHFNRVYTVEARVDAVTTGGSLVIIMVNFSHGEYISYEKEGYWHAYGSKLLSLEKIG